MSNFTSRPFRGEADLPAMVEVINLYDKVENLDQNSSVEELRQRLEHPDIKGVELWENEAGELAAVSWLMIMELELENSLEGRIVYYLLPDLRGSELETRIIHRLEEQMRQVKEERKLPVTLAGGGYSQQTERIALFQKLGFELIRYFFTMKRPLDLPIPEPQFPAGFTLRQVVPQEDGEAWVEMFNDSFIDHWHHHPMTIEHYNFAMQEPEYNPELDLVAVAPDGKLAAFSAGSISHEKNQRTGQNEGWIELLGTRRGYRNLGLGRAILLAGIQSLKAHGVDTAVLMVDADSLTGATRLYESVGFSRTNTVIRYDKTV